MTIVARFACMLALLAASLSTQAAFLWTIESGRVQRIDTERGAVDVVADVETVVELLPLVDGSAWARTPGGVVRIDADLSIGGRLALDAAGFHWEASTRTLWIAAGAELVEVDDPPSIIGIVSLPGAAIGLAGSGPEALWVATERALIRVGSDGGIRDQLDIGALLDGTRLAGVIADTPRALVWLVPAEGDLVAIDVAQRMVVARQVTLPGDATAVHVDPTSGELRARQASGWRVVDRPLDRGDVDRDVKSATSLGVLQLSRDQASLAVAGPIVSRRRGAHAEAFLVASPRVSLAAELAIVDGSDLRVRLAPLLACGANACKSADALLATSEARVAVAGRALRAASRFDGEAWRIEFGLGSLDGPATYAGEFEVVDGFGNSTGPQSFAVTVDGAGREALDALLAKATPAVSLSSPANNASFVAPASVPIAANASVTGATLTKVEFYRNGTLLATDTTAPYSYAWSGVAAGSYALTAKAYDSTGGTATSPTVSITVRANVVPAVTLTSPANNLVVLAPATVALNASASDGDGSVAKVEFFRGSTRIATVTAPPFQYAWTNVAAGTYAITAKATDDKGAVTTSAVSTLIVNAAPAVSLTAPVHNAVFVAPVNVTISASASDADGSIAKVEFYRGTTRVATDTTSPYGYAWSGVPIGAHTFTAKAYDNRGAITTSKPITFSVNANVGPSVALTSPAPGAQFVHPASVPMAATATDADGAISRVEFHYDYGAIGSDATSPYTMTWNSGLTGTYTLVAKAFDNKGAVTSSAPVTITIAPNQPPSVILSGDPAPGSIAASTPPTFRLTAVASDPDGTIASVRFSLVDYAWNAEGDETVLFVDTSPPFAFDWTATRLQPSYQFRAVATDNVGNTARSEIAYDVSANDPPLTVVLEPASAPAPAVFHAPATIVLVAEVDDTTPGDRVASVQFIANGSVLQTLSAANGGGGEYVHVWRDVPVGDHAIRVRAVDGFGSSTDRVERQVRVLAAATSPTLTLVQPLSGQGYGPAVPLSVSLVPGSAPISHVEYVNAIGMKVASSSTPPFAASWEGATAGRHAITAVAIDEHGRATPSPTVFFDVAEAVPKQPPLVVITAPTAVSSISADAPIIVSADAQGIGAPIAKVDFYAGSTLLGTSTAPPYRISWANPGPLGKVTLTARVTDSTAPAAMSTSVSSPITITLVSANARPVVNLTSPMNGTSFAAPATIAFAATASDPGGSIAKVEFFAGSTLVGTDTTAPFAFSWSGVGPGSYVLTAKATDNGGATTVSVPISVNVSANTPPVIALTSPPNGGSFAFGAPITISATTTDAETGSPTLVEFFDGATRLGTRSTPPYTYVWTGATVGAHTVTARATDNLGAKTTSEAATITVTANALPSVNLVLPRPAQHVLGSPVRLLATASDADGQVASVEFVSNGVVIASVSAPPYEHLWTNAPPGSQQIVARAIDNRGAVAMSPAASVNVAPLALTVTSPAAGATITSDAVYVSGTVGAPTNAGVIVNGVRAQRYGNQFFANHVPLAEGANEIVVTLFTADGQSITDRRGVTRAGQSALRLSFETDNGFTPHTTMVKVENRTGLAITNVAIENLGGATFAPGGDGSTTLGSITFASMKVYAPTIVVTDSAGTVHRQTLGGLAVNRSFVEATVKEVWNAYTALLGAGRVDLALASMLPLTAERFRPILEPLASHFGQIIPTWSAPEAGAITGYVGELTVARTIEGKKRLFFVYLVKDGRGIWQLDSM